MNCEATPEHFVYSKDIATGLYIKNKIVNKHCREFIEKKQNFTPNKINQKKIQALRTT